MSLILAVEPDRRRGRQLASLVRRYTNADIVVAQSGAAALSAIGARVPDLILTPALLPSHDDAVITSWLRELGDAAAHVQTLAVPILSESDSAPREGGSILGKLLDRNESGAAGHGCEPSVFADQIKVYLERAATDRSSRVGSTVADAPVVKAHAPAPAKGTAAPPAPEKTSPPDFDFEEISLDSLVLEPFIDSPTDAPKTPPPEPAAKAPSPNDEAPARQALKGGRPKTRSASPAPADKAAVRAWEQEFGLGARPGGSPALWRVSEGLPEEREDDPVYEVAPASEAPATPVVEATTSAPSPRTRSRHDAAPKDDWAYFDPLQTRFKALVRRLDEVVAQHAASA